VHGIQVDMPTPIKPLPLSAYPMEVVPVVEEVGEEENEGKVGATRRGIGEAAQEEADEDAVEKCVSIAKRRAHTYILGDVLLGSLCLRFQEFEARLEGWADVCVVRWQG
jgi:hypothetical protein